MDLMGIRRRLLEVARKINLIPDDDPANPNQYYTHTSTGSIRYSEEEGAFYSSGKGIGNAKHSGTNDRLYIASEDIKVKFSVEYKNVGTTYGLRFYKNATRITDIHGSATAVWRKYQYVTNLTAGDYFKLACYDDIYWKNLRVERV